MDGPWVKAYAALEVHRKTARMVATLDCIPAVVIGGLMQVWWMGDREATPDGFLPHTTREDIDAKVRVPGFAAAMEAVGWLEVSGDGVALPEFDKHMGQKHRKRARDRKHAKAYRDRQKRQRRVSADAVLTDTDRQRTVSGSSDKTETKTTPQRPTVSSEGTRARGAASSAWRSILDDTEFAALRHHDGFADAWASWLEFRRESGWSAPKAVTHRKQFRAALKFGPAAMVAAIEDSIRQGYQGLFPEKHKRPGALPIDQGPQDARSELTRPRPASEVVEYWRARLAQQGPSEDTPRDAEFEEGRHAS